VLREGDNLTVSEVTEEGQVILHDDDGNKHVLRPDGPVKLRVVVEMFGGTIQHAYHDDPNVIITDMVFLEDSKYADEMEDEFYVKDADGKATDAMIYTHLGDLGSGDVAEIERVLEAANERIEADAPG
jgi:hypothetical protein